MKKVAFIATALLPVVYAFLIGLAALSDLNDDPLFIALGIYIFIGLILSCLTAVWGAKMDAKAIAVGNIWLFGVNLAFFIGEVILWLVQLEEVRIAEQNGAMGGGLGLLLLIILYIPHWATYCFSHVAGAVGCARALKGRCGDGAKLLHCFLHLFPVTDLASAIWVYRKVKQAE